MSKYIYPIHKKTAKRVVKIKVKAICEDATGKISVTDIMLQAGSNASSWNGHPSEVRWCQNG